jgi:gamma-glutamylcyclotransferase (GGCT)/AIG2-like uncharacterized protein YtfP
MMAMSVAAQNEDSSTPVGPPNDVSLPVFVYGSLQPGELAWHQLADLNPTVVDTVLERYELLIRDGLPLVSSADASSWVDGALLAFSADTQAEAYRRIGDYEPARLYRWQVVVTGAGGTACRAQVLIGRNPGQGHSEAAETSRWRSSDEPMFAVGWPTLLAQVQELEQPSSTPASAPEYWRSALPRQGLFLTAWTMVERFAAFRYGPRTPPTRAVSRLDDEFAELVRELGLPNLEVRSTLRPTKRLKTINMPFAAWYQVRSNLTHRGKGGIADLVTLDEALKGLAAAFSAVLKDSIGPRDERLGAPPKGVRGQAAPNR